MKSSRDIAILVLLSIVIGSVVFMVIHYQYQECIEKSGDYVRGVFWFKCLLK
jgi:hypothetical protein